jgi:transposase
VAILEICGFHDWLVKLLQEYGCREIVVIQPEKRSKKKTDRRDANKLGEILWTNRARLLDGKRIQGIRRVFLPSEEEAHDRQVTSLRKRLGALRTRTINKVQRILLKHNLQHACPTKGIQTKTARKWLTTLELPSPDRFEMNQLLAQWKLWDQQLQEVEQEIKSRYSKNDRAVTLSSLPGGGAYTSLGLACRIGDIERFPRPGSLANYWGLTPGCRNSGDVTDRLGSITKEGSAIARFLLAQLVLHVLRKDPWMKQWYGRIKRRRGTKIARVAVMRRLATIIWHMVKYDEPYVIGGPPKHRPVRELLQEFRSPSASAPAPQKGPPLPPSPSVGPGRPAAGG